MSENHGDEARSTSFTENLYNTENVTKMDLTLETATRKHCDCVPFLKSLVKDLVIFNNNYTDKNMCQKLRR